MQSVRFSLFTEHVLSGVTTVIVDVLHNYNTGRPSWCMSLTFNTGSGLKLGSSIPTGMLPFVDLNHGPQCQRQQSTALVTCEVTCF